MRQSLWEKLTIEQLREIELKKAAFKSVLDHISILRDESNTLKGTVTNNTPVTGGKLNKEEERRLNNLSLREELENNARKLKNDIKQFNQAWGKLGETEQLVLTYFYVDRPNNYIDKLMEKLCYEKSKIYYIKDGALYRLAMLLYGNK